MSAEFKKEYLIQIKPKLNNESFNQIKKEVDSIAKSIRKNTKITFDLDENKDVRNRMQFLKKELKEITGLSRITSEINLGELDLDSKDLVLATKKLKEFTDLAQYSQDNRQDANFLSFKEVLKELRQVEKIYEEIEEENSKDTKNWDRLNELAEDYENKMTRIAKLGYAKNAFSTDLRKELEQGNLSRQGIEPTGKVGTDRHTLEVQALNAEAKRASDSFDDLNAEMKGMENASKGVEEATDDTKKLATAANKAEDSIDKTNKSMKGAGKGSGLKGAKKDTDNLVESFKKMARWSVVAFAWRGMADQVREGIRYLKELDVVLTEIAVVTGKSREQVYELGRSFNQMAKDLGRTTAEVAEASKIFFRQGKTTEEVMLLVEASTKAASVAHINLAEASDYLTSTLNGFQMEATQAMEVVDKFSAVGANAGTSFEEMAQALKKVASSANNANVDMDHMISYLATVSEVTREAPENIGTSFKTLFARMQKITDGDMPAELNKVDQALGSIGISLTDGAGQIKSLQPIVEELGGAWQGLTKNQQAYLATSIAGTRQQVRFISLMDNYDRSLEILGTSINSAGEGQRQFNQYLGGFEAKLKAAKAEVESLYAVLKESGALEYAVEAFTGFIQTIGALIDGGKTAETILIALTAALTGYIAKTIIATAMNTKLVTSTIAAAGSNAGFLTILKAVGSALATTATGATATSSAFATLVVPMMAFAAAATAIFAGYKLAKYLTDTAVKMDRVAENTKEATDRLNDFANLESRVEYLAKKHKKLSEVIASGLSSYEEQIKAKEELLDVEKELGQLLPDTVTAFNDEGEAIAINTEYIQKNLEEKRKLALLNFSDSVLGKGVAGGGGQALSYKGLADSIAEAKENLEKLKKEESLSKGARLTTGYFDVRRGEQELEELERLEEKAIENKRNYYNSLEEFNLVEKSADDFQEMIDSGQWTADEIYKAYEGYDDTISSLQEAAQASQEVAIELIPKKIGEKRFLEDVDSLVEELKTNPDLRDSMNKMADYSQEQLVEALQKTMAGGEVSAGMTEIVKQIFDTMGKSMTEASMDDIVSIFNELHNEYQNGIVIQDDYLTLSKTLTKQIDGGIKARKTLIGYTDEYNEAEEFSLETINKLTEEYPELISKTEDHAEVQDFLKRKIKETTQSMQDNYKERLFFSEEYTSEEKEIYRKSLNDLAEDRGIDLQNYKDLQTAKIAVLDSFANRISATYNKLILQVAGSDSNLAAEAEHRLINAYRSNTALGQYAKFVEDTQAYISSVEIDTSLFDPSRGKDTSGTEEELATRLEILEAEKAKLETQYAGLELMDDLLVNGKSMVDNLEDRIAKEKEIQAELEKTKEGASELELINIEESIQDSLNGIEELKSKIAGLYDEEIDEITKRRIELEEEAVEKITEIYTKQHEKRIQEENEDFDNFIDNNNKRIEAVKKRHEEEDYKKELKDRRKEQSKVQDRINEYRLIGTEASRKKILELEKEYAEIEASIEEQKLDKTRDLELDALAETGRASTEAHQNRINEIEDEHSNKMGKIEEEFDFTKLKMTELEEITKQFGEEGKSSIRLVIDEIKEMALEYEQATGKMKDLQFQNDKFTAEYEQGNSRFYNMSEEDMQKYITNKFNWNQTDSEDDKEKYFNRNQAFRQQYGITSDENTFSDMLQIFLDRFDKRFTALPEYSSGGISTGTQLAQLHGTKAKPEFIFNYEQMGALSGLIGNQGTGITIGSLVNVEGNITDENVGRVTSAVESGIEKLTRAISDKGKITRLSGSYL